MKKKSKARRRWEESNNLFSGPNQITGYPGRIDIQVIFVTFASLAITTIPGKIYSRDNGPKKGRAIADLALVILKGMAA